MKLTITRRAVAAIGRPGCSSSGHLWRPVPRRRRSSLPGIDHLQWCPHGSLGSTAYTITMPAKFNALCSCGVTATGFPRRSRQRSRCRWASRRARRTRRSRSRVHAGVRDRRRLIGAALPRWPMTRPSSTSSWRRLRPDRCRVLPAGLSTPEAVQANELMIRHINAGPSRARRRSWSGASRSARSSPRRSRSATRTRSPPASDCGVLAGRSRR